MKPVRLYLMLAVSLTMFSGLGLAKGKDGQTPAEETVCDELSGAAYGLCNAYCEAMDCDDESQATKKACEKVAANFTKITGMDELPCETSEPPPPPVEECPCFDTADVTGLVDHMFFCIDNGNVSDLTFESFEVYAIFSVSELSAACSFFVETLDSYEDGFSFNLTPDQVEACQGAVSSVCEASFCGGIAGFPCPDGLTCVDDPNDNCDPAMGGADCNGMCIP